MVDLREPYGHKIMTPDQIAKVIGARPRQHTTIMCRHRSVWMSHNGTTLLLERIALLSQRGVRLHDSIVSPMRRSSISNIRFDDSKICLQVLSETALEFSWKFH